VFDIVVIVPASMLFVCALARHWHTLAQLRKDVDRERERIADELKRYRGLCL
jgi:hypothetical protein